MSKHTPGPWEISKFVDGDSIVESTGPAYWIQPKHRPILPAAACVGGYTQEEAQANARLIAAAPELLRACEYVVNWHRENDSGEGELFGMDFVTTCIAALRAADPNWKTSAL